MAWNKTLYSSSVSSLLTLNNKNRREQVLGMGSLQVSPTIIRGARKRKGWEMEVYNKMKGMEWWTKVEEEEEGFEEEYEDEEEEEEFEGNCGNNKKRRLSAEQVRYLEESFEAEKKLEPERKAAIANRLGLEARQVAVWFQNRRARSKGKALERDYNALRADYQALFREHQTLKAEVDRLATQLRQEKGSSKAKKARSSNEQHSTSSPAIDNINDDNAVTSHQHVHSNLAIKFDGDDCNLILWPDLIRWHDEPPPFFCY